MECLKNIKTYASAAQGETSERERTVTTEKNCDIGLLRKVLLSRGWPIGFTTKLMLQIYKNNLNKRILSLRNLLVWCFSYDFGQFCRNLLHLLYVLELVWQKFTNGHGFSFLYKNVNHGLKLYTFGVQMKHYMLVSKRYI